MIITTKQIFDLRKEGKINQALGMARSLYQFNSFDIWTIRAYGWCLVSKISQTKDQEESQQIRRELRRLNIQKNDESLYVSAQKALNPHLSAIRKAGQLSKEQGRHIEAKSILSDILKADPDNQEALNTLGWVNYRLLGDKNTADKHKILQELSQIIPRITEKNTLLIRQLAIITSNTKFSYENYADFFKACIYPYLRVTPRPLDRGDELYGKKRNANNKSLEEIAIKGMYRHLKQYPGNIDSVSNWFNKILLDWKDAHWDDKTWGPYYYGRLLAWCTDNMELALSKLLMVARMKKDEYWVWDALADCMDTNEMKIDCYCRAINSNVSNETFLVNIYTKLALLMKDGEKKAESAYAAGLAKDIYMNNNRNIPEELNTIILLAKYEVKILSKDEFDENIRQLACKADEILYRDLPEVQVNFVSENYNPEKDKYYSEFIREDKTKCLLRLGRSIVLKPGDCMKVKIQNTNSKQHIVWWDKREGEKWDLVNLQPAVVVHTNLTKGFLLASITKDDTTIIHYNQFPSVKKLKVGDILNVRVMKTNQGKFNTIDFSTSVPIDLPDFVNSFEGEFNFAEGKNYGFVECDYGTVFVSPTYTKKLSEGKTIRGLAIYQQKPTSFNYGWKAIRIDRKPKLNFLK